MSIKHHLTDALIMAYSAGSLPEAFSLVVATHISLCDECRARLESYDAVGGALLEETGVADVSDASLDAVLARIAGTPDEPRQPVARMKDAVFPAPLRDYVGGDLDDVKWKRVGGGVRQAVLKTASGARVRLLSIPGGTAMPDHGHRGTEMTMVLKGAFRDEEGRFGRGDVEVANEDMEHTPVAEEGEDCICLAATDAPLRFNALIPRIAQPFLGI
ncbi:MAG: cupin domain-containing protein [Rhodobacteraceae bacterium]|nr:cupin domain-containing protein [Paracoccaceae bacterium]